MRKTVLPPHESVLDDFIDSNSIKASAILEALRIAESIIIHHYCVNNPNNLGEVESTLNNVVSPLYKLRNGIELRMEEEKKKLATG